MEQKIPAGVKAFILTKALEQRAKDAMTIVALEHIRASYFEEYTDATEMDDEFEKCFEAVFNLLFPSGSDEYGNTVWFYMVKPGSKGHQS